MRMLTGLSKPTSGEIYMFGNKISNGGEYFSRVGHLIDQPGFFPSMSAYENLKLKCMALGYKDKGYIDKILHDVGLGEVGRKHVRKFSLGMKGRLGIAMALVGEPDLLVLDEPTNGLDPQGISNIREIVENLCKEKNMTILISSHILGELSKFATHYGIIDKGDMIEEISKDELMAKCCEQIEIKLDEIGQGCRILDELGFAKYKVMDQHTICIFERIEESKQINKALAENGVYAEAVRGITQNLEEYFLEKTGGK